MCAIYHMSNHTASCVAHLSVIVGHDATNTALFTQDMLTDTHAHAVQSPKIPDGKWDLHSHDTCGTHSDHEETRRHCVVCEQGHHWRKGFAAHHASISVLVSLVNVSEPPTTYLTLENQASSTTLYTKNSHLDLDYLLPFKGYITISTSTSFLSIRR